MMSRGFTLVELAITTAIIGLLVGMALGPARQSLRQDDIESAREDLQKAQGALLAYVVRNRTPSPPRQLRGFASSPKRIPAGRPYFPCPDIDGDGLEDRNANGAVDDSLNADMLTVIDPNVANGACMRHKGLLPWRTIGASPSTDKWGTYFTYRVDPHFSHAGLGFGPETRADSADTFATLGKDNRNDGDPYERRAGVLGTDAPAIICLSHDCLTAARATGGAPSLAAVLNALSEVKIGMMITASISFNQRSYRRWDVANGAVFVLMSHGRNRLGGVSADTGQCLQMDDEEEEVDSPYELQNAFYAATTPPHPLAAKGCYTRLVVPPHPAVGSSLNESVFVNRPPGGEAGGVDGARETDDIISWMSADELARRLAEAGVFPAPQLEFLPQ